MGGEPLARILKDRPCRICGRDEPPLRLVCPSCHEFTVLAHAAIWVGIVLVVAAAVGAIFLLT
jgi:RNA polymerase subunit RPABC4/transcription elongation factor Spt4